MFDVSELIRLYNEEFKQKQSQEVIKLLDTLNQIKNRKDDVYVND